VSSSRRDRVACGNGRHAAALEELGERGLGCGVSLAAARFAIGEGAEKYAWRLACVQGSALPRAPGLQQACTEQVHGQLAVGLNVARGEAAGGLGQRGAIHRSRQPQILAGLAGQAVANLRLQGGQASLSQREIHCPSRAGAPHEGGAHEVLVSGAFYIGWRLAQGAPEKSAHTHILIISIGLRSWFGPLIVIRRVQICQDARRVDSQVVYHICVRA